MLLPLDEVPVHVPLRRPRPLRFERLPVPVWNPYSRGRLSPAKSEDRKGGEGKTDANLTIFRQPNQNTDRADLQGSRRQQSELPNARKPFGPLVGGPDRTGARDETPKSLLRLDSEHTTPR